MQISWSTTSGGAGWGLVPLIFSPMLPPSAACPESNFVSYSYLSTFLFLTRAFGFWASSLIYVPERKLMIRGGSTWAAGRGSLFAGCSHPRWRAVREGGRSSWGGFSLLKCLIFIGPRYTWGPIYGSESLSLTHRALVIQVIDSIQRMWSFLAKFGTNASGTIWLLKLELMQVSPSGGQICS